MQPGWECIYTSDKQHKISIAQALLQEERIESVAINKTDSAYVNIGEIELYVKVENAIFAKLIIEQNIL